MARMKGAAALAEAAGTPLAAAAAGGGCADANAEEAEGAVHAAGEYVVQAGAMWMFG